jgi:uncharacterized protein
MNKVLISVILAGFGAQLAKLIIYWFKHKSLSLHDIFVTGGMPSSHSAFVVSLTTIIYLTEGATALFSLSLVFAMVVVRDAYGVRRTAGNEGKALKKLFKAHHLKSKDHYAMGHTPKQVIIGSIIGFIVAFGVYFLL